MEVCVTLVTGNITAPPEKMHISGVKNQHLFPPVYFSSVVSLGHVERPSANTCPVLYKLTLECSISFAIK